MAETSKRKWVEVVASDLEVSVVFVRPTSADSSRKLVLRLPEDQVSSLADRLREAAKIDEDE